MSRPLHRRAAAALPAAVVAVVLAVAAGGPGATAQADQWETTYTPSEYAARQQALSGNYDGVGVRLRLDSNRLLVADVGPGTPADLAGMRAGEQVVSVDARDVSADDLDEVVRTLRTSREPVDAVVSGESGTRRVTLSAVSVDAGSVTASTTADGDRVVRIDSVTKGSAGRVVTALQRLSNDDGAGVVLDLRGNGGGLVTEAVEIAGVFVDGGAGVSYDRADGSRRTLNLPSDRDVIDAPLVVLVDDHTASAAEIVAGILQDRGRAIVVGQRTFGKGTVQEPIKQADGSVVERTVGRYSLPSGRMLDRVGLTPDVLVDADHDVSTLAAAASIIDGLAPRDRDGR